MLGDLQGFASDASRFREQGVGLAPHFLQKKIKLLTCFWSAIQMLEEVLDVRVHPHDFFLDIAAIGEYGCFLKNAVGISLGAHQFLKAGLQLIHVGLENYGTELVNFGSSGSQANDAIAQFPFDSF